MAQNLSAAQVVGERGAIKLKFFSVTDPEFRPYGRILTGYDVKPLLTALEDSTPLPENVEYVAEEPAMQQLRASQKWAVSLFDRETGFLWACNKWLLAHPDSKEAQEGAAVALAGENLDLNNFSR